MKSHYVSDIHGWTVLLCLFHTQENSIKPLFYVYTLEYSIFDKNTRDFMHEIN